MRKLHKGLRLYDAERKCNIELIDRLGGWFWSVAEVESGLGGIILIEQLLDEDLYGSVQAGQKEWKDGLPPVGCTVEHPSGTGVVMLPPDSAGIVIVKCHEYGEYKRVAAKAIKPIRTEEEKRRDDDVNEITRIASKAEFHTERELATLLVDAGFTRVVGKKKAP